MNLCDKVQDEGPEGSRQVIASLLKRLTHRNANVQLYALALAEALSKNCSIELHRELSSKSFTTGLDRLITDRTTHAKVQKRALGLVAMWTASFESDPSFSEDPAAGVMQDLFDSLKARGFSFETPQEPEPVHVDDEIRRKEEEELQRVLELSMEDKGGRTAWSSGGWDSGGAGGSGASGSSQSETITHGGAGGTNTTSGYGATRYNAGYAPAAASTTRQRTPSPEPVYQPPASTAPKHNIQTYTSLAQAAAPTPASEAIASTGGAGTIADLAPGAIVTRVRALHTFTPTEPGELPFTAGDVIKVVDRGYKDWWRGQLRGRTGSFFPSFLSCLFLSLTASYRYLPYQLC